MSTSIWLNDPTILLKHDNLKDIWPLEKMGTQEKVNAITRLVILMTLLGYLLTLSCKIIYLGFITLGIILVLYYFQKDSVKKEKFSNRLSGVYPALTNPKIYDINKDRYEKPTTSNPLMNVLVPEIYYTPERKPAAPSFNPTVEKGINISVKDFVTKETFGGDKEIGNKLFADLGDDLEFDRSMIQFNSNPATTVPNDRESFQEYLYGDMISAKEGNPFALERYNAGAYNYTL
jgi:hypothetical protein